MKVGILTFQRADNYGAMLQCYALWAYLKRKEPGIEVIDYRNPRIEKWYRVLPYFEKNILRWGKRIWMRIPDYIWMMRRRKRFFDFRKKINFSMRYSYSGLMNHDNVYDLIISGSDQLFNPDTTIGFDDVYFLMMPGNYIHSTYAVSLGDIHKKEFQSKDFLSRIEEIQYVSVREEDAYEYLNSIGIRARYDVDPTFLLSSEEWECFGEEIELKLPDKYIVLYYVQKNDDLIKAALTIAKFKSMPILYFDHELKLPVKAFFVGTQGPCGFIKIINHADIVVTSSFHASAFASIFQKELVMMLHATTGSRVKSLAGLLGVSERIFIDMDDFIARYDENNEIQYDFSQLERMVQSSKDYLKMLLKQKDA